MAAPLQRTDLIEDRCLRGRRFCEAWTQRVEEWLAGVYLEALGDAAGEMALVAVGGQGRREMAPQSDLDLLLLLGPTGLPPGAAEKLWYPIWDAGLKLGHSVRSIRETLSLAGEDLETATALLSARHLCGDAALSTELAERARANWRRKGRRWLETLARAIDERHAAAGEVAFALEPDLKEGRGGLRDVHGLAWAAAAGAAVDTSAIEHLRADHDVLLDVRVELHRVQGKAGDRLLLQEQDAVAMGCGDEDADALMARVALSGRSIAFVCDEAWHDIKTGLDGTFFGRLRRDRRVDEDMVVRGARVALVQTGSVVDPFAALEVANLAARQGVRIERRTLEELAAAPAPPDRWPREGRDRLVDLLLAGPSAVGVVETLDQWGLWTRYLPEWAPAHSRPQRNAYHRFTVDRHLLETVAEAGTRAHRVPRPDLLVVAALLHDLGKAYPERGDHSEVGAELAEVVATRLGFDPEDVATLVALVRHHLLLADVATRRDLGDPATVELVAAAVGSVERMELLAVLTEADSLATGSSAWSSWKATLVEELTVRASQMLGGDQAPAAARDHFPTAEQRRLMDQGGVNVLAEGDRMVVACPDRPGVFYRVAGALALHGLDVINADIHSEGGVALDEFRVRPGSSGGVPWDRVTADVTKVLEGRLALQARLEQRARSHRRRGRGIHELPPSVSFDNDSSAGSTVLEVVGPDSMGLLYRLTRALAELELNVSAARIHTVGDDVVDSFYVTALDGARIEDADLQSEIRLALLDAMEATG